MPRLTLFLTEQEWDDLAEMVRDHVLTDKQRRWAARWEHKKPAWREAGRRSDLASRLIAASPHAVARPADSGRNQDDSSLQQEPDPPARGDQ